MSDDNYSIIENKSFVEDCSSKILDEEKVCRTCLNISKSFNEIKVQGNDEYLINMVTMCLPQLVSKVLMMLLNLTKIIFKYL